MQYISTSIVVASSNTLDLDIVLKVFLPPLKHLKNILWHHQLRHLHINVIKKISQIVMGICGSNNNLPLCEGCIFDEDQVTNFPFESN
jgi:hypothetical protein